jgi:hypothetical protein
MLYKGPIGPSQTLNHTTSTGVDQVKRVAGVNRPRASLEMTSGTQGTSPWKGCVLNRGSAHLLADLWREDIIRVLVEQEPSRVHHLEDPAIPLRPAETSGPPCQICYRHFSWEPWDACNHLRSVLNRSEHKSMSVRQSSASHLS